VANITKDIAIQTQQIARDIVNDANEKEFIGKDDIKAKKVEHIKNIVTEKTKISKKESITSDETTITQLKPIVSQVTNDEWKSF
jgi:methyl-accepting chemotaxis protein